MMSLCLQSAQEYRKRDDHWAPQHHFWPWIEIVEQRLAAGHEPDSSAAMALQTFIELFKELRLILVEDAPLLMKETLSTIPSVSSVTHPVKATLGFQSKVWDLDFFAHPSSPFPLYAEQHCKEVELDVLEHARKCVPEGLQIMEAIKAWGCQTLAILMIILRNTSGMSMQAPIQQLLPNLVNPSPSTSLLEAATTDPSTSGLPMASEIQAILAAAAGTRAGGSHASTSGCIAGASAVGNEAPVEEPPGILSAQAATARDQAPEATGGTAPARHGRTKQSPPSSGGRSRVSTSVCCSAADKESKKSTGAPWMASHVCTLSLSASCSHSSVRASRGSPRSRWESFRAAPIRSMSEASLWNPAEATWRQKAWRAWRSVRFSSRNCRTYAGFPTGPPRDFRPSTAGQTVVKSSPVPRPSSTSWRIGWAARTLSQVVLARGRTNTLLFERSRCSPAVANIASAATSSLAIVSGDATILQSSAIENSKPSSPIISANLA